MHISLRVPHRRWMGREICGSCHDRSLRPLRYDVVVDVHLHERRVKGSGDLAMCSRIHVFRTRAMIVSIVAMRAGAASGGERSSPRARLQGYLLAFVEIFLQLDLPVVLADEE